MTAPPAPFLKQIVDQALKQGADAADVLYVHGTDLSVSCRLGNLESIERSEGDDIGLRVFINKQQAVVSSSNLSPESLKNLVTRAVDMAKVTPADPYCGIATEAQLYTEIPELENHDPTEFTAQELGARALATEQAALDIKGINNSEGAEASFGAYKFEIYASNGLYGSFQKSYHSSSVAVIAGEKEAMERDYEYATKVFAQDLPPPEKIGRSAAERTLKRLNARKVKTGTYPVIMEPRVSTSLVRNFAGAVNGSSIARKSSFLKDAMGEALFPQNVHIIDDPHMKRGLSSKPFDVEGIGTKKLNLIENGILKNWVLDLSTARQLNLQTNGRANRGTTSVPHPACTNLYMAAGEASLKEMIADIREGYYVTETMGMGVDLITGNYSQGSSGFWIENGQLTYPVSEVTIAGHLKDMMKNLVPANDLTFKYSVNAPSIRLHGMTIAGE